MSASERSIDQFSELPSRPSCTPIRARIQILQIADSGLSEYLNGRSQCHLLARSKQCLQKREGMPPRSGQTKRPSSRPTRRWAEAPDECRVRAPLRAADHGVYLYTTQACYRLHPGFSAAAHSQPSCAATRTSLYRMSLLQGLGHVPSCVLHGTNPEAERVRQAIRGGSIEDLAALVAEDPARINVYIPCTGSPLEVCHKYSPLELRSM